MSGPEAAFARWLEGVPESEACPARDWKGANGIIRALWYRSADYEGMPTRTFAYAGVPADASPANPVPAVVLVHGGGGTAFAEWVDRWLGRGYAAIAIDTNGCMPSAPGSGHCEPDGSGQGGPPGAPCFEDIGRPLEAQWMYAAVSRVLLAHSLLRADRRIDPARVGLTGISWGGLIASIAIGFDSRFAFAVPVYGCGFLHLSRGEFSTRVTPGSVAELWDPGERLERAAVPTLWLNGDGDPFFSADASSRSADAARGALTLLPDMAHGHREGWEPAEIARFADGVVRGGGGLIVIEKEQATFGGGAAQVTLQFVVPGDMAPDGAYIRWLETDLAYAAGEPWRLAGKWQTAPIAADWRSGTLTAAVPPRARWCYVNLVGTDGNERWTTSSRLFARPD